MSDISSTYRYDITRHPASVAQKNSVVGQQFSQPPQLQQIQPIRAMPDVGKVQPPTNMTVAPTAAHPRLLTREPEKVVLVEQQQTVSVINAPRKKIIDQNVLPGYKAIAIPLHHEIFKERVNSHTMYLWMPDTSDPVHYKREPQTAFITAGDLKTPYKIEHEDFAEQTTKKNTALLNAMVRKIVRARVQKNSTMTEAEVLSIVNGNYGSVSVNTMVSMLNVCSTQNKMQKHGVGFLVFEDEKSDGNSAEHKRRLPERISAFLKRITDAEYDSKLQNLCFNDPRNFTGMMRFQLFNMADMGQVEKTDAHTGISGFLLTSNNSTCEDENAFVVNSTRKHRSEQVENVSMLADKSQYIDLYDMCLLYALLNMESIFNDYKESVMRDAPTGSAERRFFENGKTNISAIESDIAAIEETETTGAQIGQVLHIMAKMIPHENAASLTKLWKITKTDGTSENPKTSYKLCVPSLFYHAAEHVFYEQVEKTQVLNKGGDIYLLAIPLPMAQISEKLAPYQVPADFIENFNSYDEPNASPVQTVVLDVRKYRQEVVYLILDDNISNIAE